MENNLIDISTHSLTGRLTICLLIYVPPKSYFNSQPHREADRIFDFDNVTILYFNSQPHREADGNFVTTILSDGTFQLTASQGG